MNIQKFEDILAWQKARTVVREVYRLTAGRDFYHHLALKSQIRRSTISIMANIAEGFTRRRRKEFVHFLTISQGSIAESKSHLYVAMDLVYISEDDFRKIYNYLDEIARIITGLMDYLKSEKAIQKDNQLTNN